MARNTSPDGIAFPDRYTKYEGVEGELLKVAEANALSTQVAISRIREGTELASSRLKARIDSIEVMNGVSPGDITDAAMSSIAANPESLFAGTIAVQLEQKAERSSTEEALMAKADRVVVDEALAGKVGGAEFAAALEEKANISEYQDVVQKLPSGGVQAVGKGELVLNVKDYGAKGDGVTDDTDSINSAAASVPADARLFMPLGIYKTTGTVFIPCAIDAGQATINYYGIGTAMVVGNETSIGITTARRHFSLPRVINKSRTTGWDGSSVGIKTVNLNTCDLYVPFVQDFEAGLWMYGYGAGNTYNTVTLGALWDNHVNLKLSHDTTGGYSNQHTFIGGRFNQTLSKGALIGDVNAHQISMLGTDGLLGPNNNVFVNVSIESNGVAYYAVDISGRYNTFYGCRWEVPAGHVPRIHYRASAQYNKIDGGYNTEKLVEVFDGNLGGGSLFDHVGAYTAATASGAGQIIPNASWATISSWNTPVGRRVTYDPATGEFRPRPGRWLITASVAFTANATGRRISRMIAGGSTLDICEVPGSAGLHSMKLHGSAVFDGTKTFKIEAFQASGAELSLAVDSPYVKVTAEYLGY